MSEERGYLTTGREPGAAFNRYWRNCQAAKRPCVHVRKHGKTADVRFEPETMHAVLGQWTPLTRDLIGWLAIELRSAIRRSPSPQARAVLDNKGAIAYNILPDDAHRIAATLADIWQYAPEKMFAYPHTGEAARMPRLRAADERALDDLDVATDFAAEEAAHELIGRPS